MRIALFHNLPSGGAKRSVYEQARYLSEKHTIDLFTLSTADLSFMDINSFIKHRRTERFKPNRTFKSPFGRLNMAGRTFDLIRLEQVMKSLAYEIDLGSYDLALVHPCQFSVSPMLLIYLKTPSMYYRHDVVRWIHDPYRSRPYDLGLLKKRLDKIDPFISIYKKKLINNDQKSMQAATNCLTNSCFVRESLYRAYGLQSRVCYQGVNEEVFRPLDDERQDFILSVGMVHRNKGYDFLIRSIGAIHPKVRPELIIVANQTDPNEKKYLQLLASEKGVSVIFREMVTQDELIKLYNKSSCVAYTPYLESFGLVPLEAMACGTPVVGVREGGVRETIVNGLTGFLVERDLEEFAEALIHFKDKRLRDRFGSQARSHILAYWTLDQASQRLEAQIEKTIQMADINPSGTNYEKR